LGAKINGYLVSLVDVRQEKLVQVSETRWFNRFLTRKNFVKEVCASDLPEDSSNQKYKPCTFQ
jgi:hypothetical protein